MKCMTLDQIETYEQARRTGLPLLAATLTWVKVNGGRAVSSTADWEEDRDATVGEPVLVSDGGPFLRAEIVAVKSDGEIELLVPAFARKVVPA